MKNIESVLGKFYLINGNKYIYFLPGKSQGSYMSSDGDSRHWESYRRIGAISEKNWKEEEVVQLIASKYIENGLFTIYFPPVGGDFYCHINELTSLEGAPSSVGGNFYCHGNNLTKNIKKPSGVKGKFLK